MLTTMLPCLISISLASVPACSEPATVAPGDGDFEALWYDGQAELCGYRWHGSRYGHARQGEAVAIFVTEPLGAESHVKVDDPARSAEPSVTVLKLNLVRDFQTGIYDYNTMTSVFVDVGHFRPLKISFSSAEWCGHVYEELNARKPDRREQVLELEVESYFQGESETRTLASPADGLVGDQLLIWLRGLRGHALPPGSSRTLPYLPDAFERRLRHVPAQWTEIQITREARPAEITVPAGTFQAVVYRAQAGDGRRGDFAIDEAYPHRLLSWRWSRGDEVLDAGELTGAQRMKYWQLHDPGQESLRAELGLPVR